MSLLFTIQKKNVTIIFLHSWITLDSYISRDVQYSGRYRCRRVSIATIQIVGLDLEVFIARGQVTLLPEFPSPRCVRLVQKTRLFDSLPLFSVSIFITLITIEFFIFIIHICTCFSQTINCHMSVLHERLIPTNKTITIIIQSRLKKTNSVLINYLLIINIIINVTE